MPLTRIISSQLFANGYSALLLAATTLLLGRCLGPQDFGHYTFVLTVVALYGMVMDGGFKTLILKEQAHTVALPHVLRTATGHLIIVSAGGMFLLALLVRDLWLLVAGLTYYGFLTLSDFVLFDMKGRGRFVEEAKWRILQRTLIALPFFLLVFSPYLKPLTVFCAFVLGFCIWFVLLVVLGRPSNFIPKFNLTPRVYRMSVPFVFINIFTLIYYRADVIMIRYLEGTQGVGLYAAAFKFMEGFSFVLIPLGHIFFQRLRQCHADRVRSRHVFFKSFFVCVPAAVVLIPGGLLLAETAMTLTFGRIYLAALPAFKVLICSLAFMAPNTVLTQAAIAFDREKQYVVVAGLSAALNILLNFILIPRYGITGAALATCATEFFLMCCLGGVVWNVLRAE